MSAREVLLGIQADRAVTAPWIDPTERVAWLIWTARAWGVETPVSGDDLARQDLYTISLPPLSRDVHVNGAWL